MRTPGRMLFGSITSFQRPSRTRRASSMPANAQSWRETSRNLRAWSDVSPDVQHAIEQTSHRCGWLRGMRERERILALLGTTLKALQARVATLESGNE